MPSRSSIAFAVSLALVGTAVLAATPAQTISARKDNFKAMGRANKAIRDNLGSSSVDFALIRANTRAIKQAAARLSHQFPRGTGPGAGVETEALPVIWTQNADFRAKMTALVRAANGLDAAAGHRNADHVKAALGALGGACKGCHDTYRLKK